MKNFIIKSSLVLSVITILIFTGCKKDKTPAANGTLMLHLHTNIDTNEADYGDVFPDSNGRKMSLSMAQFYISNISILSTNGTWANVQGAYILKTVENEEYMVGSVPSGDYTDIRFDIGIDAATNATAPSAHTSSTAADSVLANTNMWFGNTTQGYIFMNVQGMVDATSNHTGGMANTTFSYQIGSNALLKTVTLPTEDFTVNPNQQHYVHIICDYGKLLQNIDMTIPANLSTNTSTNPATAVSIADNIVSMFRYEE